MDFRSFWAILGVNDVMDGPKIKKFGNLTPPSSLPPQKLYPYQIVGENKPLIRNYNQFSGFSVILGHIFGQKSAILVFGVPTAYIGTFFEIFGIFYREPIKLKHLGGPAVI